MFDNYAAQILRQNASAVAKQAINVSGQEPESTRGGCLKAPKEQALDRRGEVQSLAQNEGEKIAALDSLHDLRQRLEVSEARCAQLERSAADRHKEEEDEEQYAAEAKQAMLILETAAAVHKASVTRLIRCRAKAVEKSKPDVEKRLL